MPRSEQAIVREYRRRQARIRDATLAEYLDAWAALDKARLIDALPAHAKVTQRLVQHGRQDAVGAAEMFLTDMRAAYGVPGAPVLVVPAAVTAQQVQTSMTATITAAYVAASRAGKPTQDALASAAVAASGAVTRMTMAAARQTVTRSSVRDPRVRGWRRLVAPGSRCPFCRMLADRGHVYTSESVRFGAHDHCMCQAAPAFAGARPTDVDEYRPSDKEISPADRARVRSWMANNGY